MTDVSNLTPSGKQHKPGLDCPECNFFIEFSIVSLLQRNEHICPGCGLVLHLNRAESTPAMQSLQQLQVAVENLEVAKKNVGAK